MCNYELSNCTKRLFLSTLYIHYMSGLIVEIANFLFTQVANNCHADAKLDHVGHTTIDF